MSGELATLIDRAINAWYRNGGTARDDTLAEFAAASLHRPGDQPDRILWNERDGSIDEVVLSGVNVHVEQMDKRCWWIGIYDPQDPDRYWMGNFVADSRGRMSFTEQENAGIDWWRDDSHEHSPAEGSGLDNQHTTAPARLLEET